MIYFFNERVIIAISIINSIPNQEKCVLKKWSPNRRLSLRYFVHYLGNKIGLGGFASVYKAVHLPTKSDVAVKVIDANALSAS